MTNVIVGFAGMTHLGLVSAAASAERGFAVIGYDADAGLIERLDRSELSVFEPNLSELVAQNRPRLSFSADPAALGDCDVVYIAPDVPTDDDGGSDLAAIHDLIATVRRAARKQAILVVLSQVPPGFTRAYHQADARFYYQVETLIFGRAVERALHPERFIVGCADPSRRLPEALSRVLGAFDCPILPMRLESAELTKISINMCLVASISVANTMSELCEKIGADWSEMAPALKLDKRIGAHAYLAPGLGLAGGNLERDLATVVRLAGEHGADSGVIRAWVANSRHRRDWVLRVLGERILNRPGDPLIGILGLAYKQDTASTKNSPSLALIGSLSGVRLLAFDPRVAVNQSWHPRMAQAASALAACDEADALAIMTPWPEFKSLDPAEIARRMAGRLVIDPYGLLDAGKCSDAGLRHLTLGRPT